MRKVMGLGVAALVVAAAFAAPAQAAPESAMSPVVVASTVSVEAPAEAVVSFETPAVGTEAAPVEKISTEPGETVEEPAPVESTAPVQETEPVQATEPEPVTEPAPEVTEPATPVAEEPAPEVTEPAPAETVEPVTEPEEVTVEEIVPDPYSPEIIEGQTLVAEGETYIGSFYSLEDIWTAQGNRVVKSETIFKSADGNPLSNNYIYIWHVYAPAA